MANRFWLLALFAFLMSGCSKGCQNSSVGPPQTAIRSAGKAKQKIKKISNAVPWKPKVREREWKYIVIHHTGTSRGSVESIHQTHRQRKDRNGNPWMGIGYHFVIGNGNGMTDGAIEPTFRWWKQIHGAHAGNWEHNKLGIGIALVGNFEEAAPSRAQWNAITKLVATLQRRYRINSGNVKGHNEIKATKCPGKHFPLHKVAVRKLSFEIDHRRPAYSD